MSDEMRRLLAGYATGTLTDDERRTLLEASLVDEELFAAIAEEEPLRELLSDPAARAELLSRIEPAPRAFRERFAAWLRRPAVAGGLVAAAVAVVVIAIVPVKRVVPVAEPPAQYARSVTPRAPAEAAQTPASSKQTANQPRKVRPARTLTAPIEAPRLEAPAAAPAEQKVEVAADAAAPAAVPAAARAAPPPPARAAAPVVPEATTSGVMSFREAPATVGMARAKLAGQAKPVPQVTLVRKAETGEYVAVDPATTVFVPGDLVRVRLEPVDSGAVSVRGAIPQQNIVGALMPGKPYETGDIRIGNEDMRLTVTFSKGPQVVRTLSTALQSSESAEGRAAGQPDTEIVLRVKKP